MRSSYFYDGRTTSGDRGVYAFGPDGTYHWFLSLTPAATLVALSPRKLIARDGTLHMFGGLEGAVTLGGLRGAVGELFYYRVRP